MSDQLLTQASTRAALSGTEEERRRGLDPALARTSRSLAARGTVLLTNDGTLPLPQGSRVALFGRIQKDWIAVGYGSGGDVNPPYVTNLLDSLRETGTVQVDEELADRYETWCAQHPADPGEVWGAWPRHYPEMPLEDEAVREAAVRNDVAVVVIGRAAGEDRDAVLEPGSYYLTDTEQGLLRRVTGAFERTVVIVDAGNVIDMSWVEEHPISAVMIAWAGGMEGGRATADVLIGAAEPGGRLTDTIARRYQDCPTAEHFGDPEVTEYVEDVFVGYRYFETFAPEAVQFPFGHGLGFTEFEIDASIEPTGPSDLSEPIRVRATVTNAGDRPGSEVVQLYVAKPDGALSVPARELVAFARTEQIEAGASTELVLEVPWELLASYDDAGTTGHRSAWVLEPGAYGLLLGFDVRSARTIGTVDVPQLRVIAQLEEACAVRPEHAFERMVLRREVDGTATVGHEPVPTSTVDLKQRILDRLPDAIEPADPAGGRSASFAQVLDGSLELDAFIAALAPEDLAALAYGDVTMDSPLGAAGNAGALGGVTESLRERGVPASITTDGPSGIRLAAYASLLPCGTALASTWDPAAVEELAALHAEEMIAKGSDMLLSPGMNIHRDPLCGRNFEYFAEDPLLTGKLAAAVVRGVQSRGVSACPKHYAANNQETNRIHSDSRVSERALREIYLRGFEIMIRESAPQNLMTSYNRINGVWGHYHYDLVTTILRDQWGYDGNVVTDWWMRMAPDPDFPALRNSAYRVRAQVDVLMPGSTEHGGTEREDSIMDSYRTGADAGGLTLGEMQRTARNVLRYLQRSGIVERRRAGVAADVARGERRPI